MSRLATALLALLVAPVAHAAEWAPTPAESSLIQALSVRDGAPSCAEVEALVPAPVTSLQAIVEHVTMPPWVGMRAADCLVTRHATETRALLETWVTKPELKGLGILVLGRIDELPLDVATDVATKAIQQGANPDDARRRVARSTKPELAALANLPAPGAVTP